MRAILIAVAIAGALHSQGSRGTPPSFTREIYPVFEGVRCRDCHTDEGVASASRLKFPAEEAPAAQVESFGLSLRRFVDAKNPDQSVLLLRPTARMAHPGGERIKRGSPGEDALRQWIAYLATLPESTGAQNVFRGTAGRPILRRLTNAQYNNTVADLLGDKSQPANQFPTEDFIHGFTNQSDGQSISPLLAEDYSRAAGRLAANYRRSGALAAVLPCKPEKASCGEQFIETFGRRVFRRPLQSAEASSFQNLLAREARRTGNFLDGAQIALEAMLQSSAFLFHTEEGGYGVASRLSYFLWNTTPDARLLDLAQSGELDTPAGIEKQTRRMLDDPRARTALNQFLNQWLRFDRLAGALRERKLYPEFGTELAGAMIEETTRLFEHVVWNDKSFLDFLNGRYTFLNTSLALLYGVEPPPQEWALTSRPQDSKRAGVFGQASFLTLTSKPAETSPTERGLFIRQHFLCQAVPPPPPGVDTTLPQLSEDRPLSNKDRLAIHLNNAACAGCHRLVDSIGFGFEQFDAIGRFHEKQTILVYPAVDKTKRNTRRDGIPMEVPVDTTATILGLANSGFTNPAEAADILANHSACQRCIVKQLFRFAVGRMETEADQPEIDRLFTRFRDSGFRFRELVIAMTTSPPFLEGINRDSGRISDAR